MKTIKIIGIILMIVACAIALYGLGFIPVL